MPSKDELKLINKLETEYEHLTTNERVSIFTRVRNVTWTPQAYEDAAVSIKTKFIKLGRLSKRANNQMR